MWQHCGDHGCDGLATEMTHYSFNDMCRLISPSHQINASGLAVSIEIAGYKLTEVNQYITCSEGEHKLHCT